MGLENEKTALQILHGAASQLTHLEETPVEADSDLLRSLLLRRKCWTACHSLMRLVDF